MTTSEKNGKPGSFSSSNGHANGHANGRVHVAHGKSDKSARGRRNDTPQARLERLLHLGSKLPRTIEAQLKDNPMRVLASVGAAAFVLGALAGSKIGRIAIAAALPLALQRILEGAVGDKLSAYTQELAGSLGGEAEA